MTDKELSDIYIKAYCAKEASFGSVASKIWEGARKAVNWPTQGINTILSQGRQAMFKDFPKKAGTWALKHPILPIAGLGAAGYYGYNQISDWYDTKKKGHPLYKVSEWVKANPGMATALAVGGITAPMWLPPVMNHFFGNKEKEGIRLGAATDRYSMGYYPGR